MDFDHIEIHNLASQGYLQDDLERPKVEATADLCHQINHQLEMHTVNGRFRNSMDIGNVLFCCVDRIESRRLIWNSTKDKVNFFTDGRMGAEVLRVLSVTDPESYEHYPTLPFSPKTRLTRLPAQQKQPSTVPAAPPGSWFRSSPSICGIFRWIKTFS